MQRYEVEVRETLSRNYAVRAHCAAEAMERVKELYREEKIVLDADDYSGVDFYVEEYKKY